MRRKRGNKKGTMPSKKKKTKIESLINHSYQLLSFLEIHQKTKSIREEIKSIKKKGLKSESLLAQS